MDNILFEWDNNKAQINFKKHGIAFEEATTVFGDEEALLIEDPDHSGNEERFLLLGMSSQSNILIVCHCYRGADEIIRIISARKATKTETKQYVDSVKGW